MTIPLERPGSLVGIGARLAKMSTPIQPLGIEEIAHQIAEDSFHQRAHLDALADLLETAVRHVQDGGTRRLVISMPPGQGKSQTSSVALPLHILAKEPTWNIGIISSEATLANKFSRDARRHAPQLGIQLAKDSGQITEWETVKGGGVIARGVGGALTGRRLKVLVMDDPIKDAKHAYSETERETLWAWYQSVAKTRMAPASLSALVMCMTGDTPVLLADGTERPLRDIRPGDRIATYDERKITVSTVRNWAPQGIDAIYSIKMESGTTVRANARHPFLTIDENGNETWVKTADLRPGHRILRSTATASTPGSPASGTRSHATSPQKSRDSVHATTELTDAAQASSTHHRTLSPTEPDESNIDMGSPLSNTTRWSRTNAVSALSVESPPATTTPERTGMASSASTMTTTLGRSEDCSVTTATLQSDTARHPKPSALPLSIYNVEPDTVSQVTPCGNEEVYDIQVDRTENFIANGLISHNTRWHEDDIAQRLLTQGWEEFRLPALAETDDILGRQPGEPLLTPQGEETPKQAIERWEQEREEVGEHVWAGLYQQRPAPAGGSIFNADDLQDPPDDLDPSEGTWITSWDLSFGGGGDYTVGTVWQAINNTKHPGGLYILHDIIRGRWEFTQQMAALRRTVQRYPQCSHHLVEAAANGAAMVDTARRDIPGVTPVKPLGGKVERWQAVTPLMEAHKVATIGGAWLPALIAEMVVAPNGKHDDQLDSYAQALNWFRVRRFEPPSVSTITTKTRLPGR